MFSFFKDGRIILPWYNMHRCLNYFTDWLISVDFMHCSVGVLHCLHYTTLQKHEMKPWIVVHGNENIDKAMNDFISIEKIGHLPLTLPLKQQTCILGYRTPYSANPVKRFMSQMKCFRFNAGAMVKPHNSMGMICWFLEYNWENIWSALG